jgi:formylglycine-generating enzyme required for sulfatase activity
VRIVQTIAVAVLVLGCALDPAHAEKRVALVVGNGAYRPLTAERERGLKPKDTFRECTDCPKMVVVPAGRFTMGSPAGETGQFNWEAPQHPVTISRQFAVGKFHVTRDQFAMFANETGFTAHPECDWRNPGFRQDGSHPVVCVSWDDANAYADWLAKKTGKPYRLLSEAEFEYAAHAGATTPFWWGSSITPAQANYNGNYVYAGGSKGIFRKGTVPVDSFQANPWGLYNVHGNAWQWTADCWHGDYEGAPNDGSAWTSTGCDNGRVLRGGSWIDNPRDLRTAFRVRVTVTYNCFGFRLARTLAP